MNNTDLRSLVRTLIEARIRETDITDGTRVPFGSPEHITDVEMRISDLERWRDRQRRGSEARANYARLIGALKRELRSATRVNAPKLVEPDALALEASVTLDTQPSSMKKKKKRKCTSCEKSFYVRKDDDQDMCELCGDMPAASVRGMMESHVDLTTGSESWVVKHRYDGYTIGFPTRDFEKAQSIADTRNNIAINGAWGRNNPTADPPYEVIPYEPETIGESVNIEDPEYVTVEDFVQFMLDDERGDTYTHEDLTALNFRTRMPIGAIRKELEGYGFKLATRAPEKEVRGFTSNSHDRWHGKGSSATHGGAGIDPQTGRATSGRGDI